MHANYVFEEHYDVLDKDFHRLFLNFLNKPTEKVIHQLRINIKQQMAFFRILRALEDHLPLEEIQMPFAAFFKSIGKIRNLEIRQSVLSNEEKKYAITDSYANKLSSSIQEEKAWWQSEESTISLVPFREVSAKVRASINRMPLQNIKETLGEYFFFLIEEIRLIVQQEDLKIEQLHDLRKLLKVLVLNLKLADRLITQAVIPDKLYQRIESYDDQLGEWHDQFITVYRLSAKKSKVDKQVLKVLKKKERMTRKAIINEFGAIYNLSQAVKQALFHLFAQDKPFVIPPRRFKESKYLTIKESLTQLNIIDCMR